MEKNDIKKLLEIIGEEMRDDFFSRKFYASLMKNYIFYQIELDKCFIFKNLSLLETAEIISEYRNNRYFKGDDKYDYIRYFKIGENVPSFNRESISGFLILENNNENIEYIKSISRDNKIKNLIK